MYNLVLKRILSISIVMLLLLSINTLVFDNSNAQRIIQLDSQNIEINDRAIQWSVTLSFSETSGQVDNAIFSEAPDGNDGTPVDPYDMPKPPAPIQPYLRAWFNDNLPIPYNLLHQDCREYPDTTKTWDLYVQWAPDDYVTPTTVTISWNSNDVNLSEYTSIILYDFDTSTPLLEMKNHMGKHVRNKTKKKND